MADFFGGLQSRQLPALAVAFWSQIAGALGLLLVLLVEGRSPQPASLAWGLAGGLWGGMGLVLFYRALAVGVMSLVAPVSACGALVPVLVSFALGDVPSMTAILGMIIAIAGVILVSLQPGLPAQAALQPRLSFVLAVGAALSFGLFFVFVNRGSAITGATPLWVIGSARGGSLLTLLTMIALGPRRVPWPGRAWSRVAPIGLLDTTANALYAYASTLGNLGIVAVLGSLFPVATVLLGRFVLLERLRLVQQVGVALALLGVALVSGG